MRRLASALLQDRRGLAVALGFGAVYLALVFLRRHLVTFDSLIAIWPGGGFLAAGLMRYPRYRWPVLAFCLAVAVGLSPALTASIRSTCGVFEIGVVAELGRRVCGPNPNLSDGRTLLKLLVGAVIPSCVLSCALLFLLTTLFGTFDPLEMAVSWLGGHALGAAIFMPAVLILMDHRRHAGLRKSNLDLALSLLAFLAAVLLLFEFGKAYAFMVFPAAMLLAFRHGPVGAAGAVLALATVALVYMYGGGVLPGLPPAGGADTAWIQFFALVVLLTALPVSGAISSSARMKTLLAARTEVARRARRHADAAAAAKSEFLANLSHEIRTPLNGVIGLADAMSRTDLTAAQREMLDMILASGRGLTALLSDALDLARTESGALRLSAEPFDVRRMVGEAAFLFESLAREKGLAFKVEFDLDEPAAAVGDALRIKQIVSNLISNAVKFTERGAVTVSARFRRTGQEAMLEVSVRDTGPGFDAATRARLFKRFEQGDGSVTRRFGGSGLGLAIASRLAAMMGAELRGDAAPGEGAVFVLRLPLKAAGKVAEERHAQARLDAGAERPRILLAEDNLINQKVIQAMLGALAELTVVADGQEAVKAFSVAAYDVILMDTHMPVMDGLTAIRLIRAEEARAGRARTPIVSLTADALAQHQQAASAAGADLHLAKPVTVETLIAALRACERLGQDGREGQAERLA